MPHRQRPNDPRIPETLKHLRILSRRLGRRLVVQDYLEYRVKHAPHLPALTTVYRLLGSWPEALAAAGVEQDDKHELSRTSDDALIAALKQAAEGLSVQVLSSHAYDEYRKAKAPTLPSSSVIRKWLGRWGEAVKQAGLETTERSSPRRPSMAEIIAALRQAKSDVEGMLTPRSYSEYHAALDAERRDSFPDVSHILTQFPDWEAALRAADVEQSDALHPTALWTGEEARKIARQVELVLNQSGKKLNKENYEAIRRRASRPMPTWKVLQYLLSS